MWAAWSVQDSSASASSSSSSSSSLIDVKLGGAMSLDNPLAWLRWCDLIGRGDLISKELNQKVVFKRRA